MKYLILLLAFITTSAFANTVSRTGGLTIDDRFYTEQDITVMQCSVQTGSTVTTCKRADGTSAASAGGTKILGLQAWHGDTSFPAFMCLHNHTGAVADIVDGPAAADGTIGHNSGLLVKLYVRDL
jgi:hypothetical protein